MFSYKPSKKTFAFKNSAQNIFVADVKFIFHYGKSVWWTLYSVHHIYHVFTICKGKQSTSAHSTRWAMGVKTTNHHTVSEQCSMNLFRTDAFCSACRVTLLSKYLIFKTVHLILLMIHDECLVYSPCFSAILVYWFEVKTRSKVYSKSIIANNDKWQSKINFKFSRNLKWLPLFNDEGCAEIHRIPSTKDTIRLIFVRISINIMT